MCFAFGVRAVAHAKRPRCPCFHRCEDPGEVVIASRCSAGLPRGSRAGGGPHEEAHAARGMKALPAWADPLVSLASRADQPLG